MAARTDRVLPARTVSISPLVGFVMLWHVVVGIGLFYGASQLFAIETFFNLGAFVPRFIAAVVALLGVVSLATAALLTLRNNSARLVSILFNFFGMALALFFLAHTLGLFIGIDHLAAGIFRNSGFLLGLPIGYALVWLGRRFEEGSSISEGVQKIGLGLMMLTVVVLLVASGLFDAPPIPGLASGPDVRLHSLLLLIGVIVGGVMIWLARSMEFGSVTRRNTTWTGYALIVTVLLIRLLPAGLLQPLPLATIAAAAFFAAAGVIILRQGEAFGETIMQREAWQGWLFLMPNFVNFLLFFAMPLILSFYLSFTDYDAVSSADFIGLDNYSRMISLDVVTMPVTATTAEINAALRQNHFEIARITLGDNALIIGARDPLFWQSLSTTIRYCIFLLILAIIPALGLAMLLNTKIPGMTFFRAVYFLPSIAAVVGVALIWQWLYDPVIGYINYTISSVVNFLNGIFGGGITDPQIRWLTDDNVMLFSAVIMAAWQVIGFNTVILLAGLQGVPKELIEASTVDGANSWTRFRKIILPMIAPTTFFVIVTTLISGLQAFSEMYVLFGNSTSNARLTTVFYLYQQGFQRFQMGYASATAWVLFAVIFVITLVQFRLSSRSRAYSD